MIDIYYNKITYPLRRKNAGKQRRIIILWRYHFLGKRYKRLLIIRW